MSEDEASYSEDDDVLAEDYEDGDAPAHGGEDDEDDDEDDEEFSEKPSKKKKKKATSSSKKQTSTSSKKKGKESPSTKKKKKKPAASKFIDEEVEVGSEEEEEDAGEVDERTLAEAKESAAVARQQALPSRTSNRAFMDKLKLPETELAQAFENAQGDMDDAEYDEEGQQQRGRAMQHSLLPSVTDPKLYAVKCKPGKENDAVFALLQRKASAPLTIRILSAVASPRIKGYLYVEAITALHARDAIQDLRDVYARDIHIVPVKEMPDVLNCGSASMSSSSLGSGAGRTTDGADMTSGIKRGDFVRMKRGVYKGDLAQVLDLDASAGTVDVKVIPRIDLDAAAAALTTNQSATAPTTTTAGGKRAPAASFVGPQKLITGDELLAKLSDQQVQKSARVDATTNDYIYTWGSKRFSGGFLLRTTKVITVDTVNVIPTTDEIQRFTARDNDGGGLLLPTSVQLAKKPPVLNKGDRVRSVSSDLGSVTGTVLSVSGADNTAVIKPDEEGLEPLTVPTLQLEKFFQSGEHIKVISGKLQDQTGVVLKVDFNSSPAVATILIDGPSLGEQKVFCNDLQKSTEVTSGMLERAGYRLHDLVQLPNKSVGMVVAINREHFSMLDTEGRVQLLSLQEMGPRKSSSGVGRSGILISNEIGLDSKQRQITVGDLVDVIDGPHKGRQATVKHFVRHFAFVQSNEVFENGGIYVVRSSMLSLIGDRQKPSASPATTRAYGRAAGPAGRGSGAMSIGKPVKVCRGRWKGYAGTIKNLYDKNAQVELQTQSRPVNIPITDLIPADGSGGSRMDYMAGGAGGMAEDIRALPPPTPMHAPKTPMRDDGSMTPSRTPMTPSHDPWNVANPNTPAHYETPAGAYADDYGSAATPGTAPPITPGYVAMNNPHTPGMPYTPYSSTAVPFAAGTREPQTPGMARTPYYAMPTPGTVTGAGDTVDTPYSASQPPATPGGPNLPPATPGGAW